MIPRCPRCGATKTDPVPHDFKYDLARALGYRLQMCSRCRRMRFLPRHNRGSRGASPSGGQPGSGPRLAERTGTLDKPQAGPDLESGLLPAADCPKSEVDRCPVCGSTKYHRTPRTAEERVLRHPAMARCDDCGARFSRPGHHEESPGPSKLVQPATGGSHLVEESKLSNMSKENTQAESPQKVPPVVIADEDFPRCPSCGSVKYHRTERTTMERILRRPRMARCEKCGKRFRYVRHPDEGKGPGTASEIARPNGGQESHAGDSSDEESSRCPFCGSTNYRRSRRSPAERLLMRPKMARCSHCRKRFPFPER